MDMTTPMRRNISLSYWILFFYHFFFFVPIWYEYETKFATPAMIGVIFAASHLLTVVLELPTGALADLIGRKKTMFFGYLIIAISWIFLGLTQSYHWLWAGYFINAAGVALASGADSALYYDSLKVINKEKMYSKIVAKQGVALRAAVVIGTFLGGTLFAIYFRLPYLLVGISTLIATVLVLLLTEPSLDTEKFSWTNYVSQTKVGFRELFKTKYIRDFSIYYILVGGLTWYFIYFLNVAFATEIGFSSQQRSMLFGITYLLVAVGNYYLIKHNMISKKMAYLLFPGLIIIGFFLGSTGIIALSVLCILLIQAAGLMRFSVLDQYAQDEFESKYRATAISSLNMFVSIVFAVLAIVGGQVISSLNIYSLMFGLGVLSLLTLTPTAMLMIRRYEKN